MIKRRRFLQFGSSILVLASAGEVQPQLDAADENEIYGLILGPDRPSPSRIQAEWDNYRFVHLDPKTGVMSSIDTSQSSWSLVEGSTVRLIDALLSDQTVSNTTEETTVFNPSIAAGEMRVGDVYELTTTGTYTTTNSSEQFTLRFHIGDTEVASVTSVAENVTDQPWYAVLSFTVREIGTDGTIKPHVVAAFDNVHDDQHSGAVSLDTTVSESFAVTVQWDEQNANDEVLVGQAYLKRLGTVG